MPTGSSTPPRKGLSEREYARHAGVSRGAVQKARSSGRLVLHADGSVDAAASDARRAQATDPSKQTRAEPPRHGFRPVPEAAVGAVAETLKEQGLTAPPPSGMTFLQARTANDGRSRLMPEAEAERMARTATEITASLRISPKGYYLFS